MPIQNHLNVPERCDTFRKNLRTLLGIRTKLVYHADGSMELSFFEGSMVDGHTLYWFPTQEKWIWYTNQDLSTWDGQPEEKAIETVSDIAECLTKCFKIVDCAEYLVGPEFGEALFESPDDDDDDDDNDFHDDPPTYYGLDMGTAEIIVEKPRGGMPSGGKTYWQQRLGV